MKTLEDRHSELAEAGAYLRRCATAFAAPEVNDYRARESDSNLHKAAMRYARAVRLLTRLKP